MPVLARKISYTPEVVLVAFGNFDIDLRLPHFLDPVGDVELVAPGLGLLPTLVPGARATRGRAKEQKERGGRSRATYAESPGGVEEDCFICFDVNAQVRAFAQGLSVPRPTCKHWVA